MSRKLIENLNNEAFEAYNKKQFKIAQQKYEELLKLEPNASEHYCNLGVILKTQKRYKEAFEVYIKALKINSKNQLVLNNLGNLFKEVKDYKNAIKAFSDAIKLNPKDFNAYNNLGIVYEAINDYNKAIVAYKEAVRVNPNYSKAINNIGVVLYKQKKYEQAIEIFKIALKVDPEYNELYSNIGACYNKLKNYELAIQNLEKAIQLNPKNAGAYTNLGNVYNKLFDYKKAAKLHEKSIELEPKGSNAYSNLGTSYKNLGYINKAIDSYKKAIELNPNFENAHFDLATIYLSKNDFKNGWSEYEWRFKKEEMLAHIFNNKDIFSQPMLRKEDNIEGKTLLLHSEQGFGDSIQFIRFLPNLKEKFKCKIAVKCRDELKELFKTIKEIDILTNRSEPTPAFDYHLPIMSMPYILNMQSLNDLPKQMPYLTAFNDKSLKIEKSKDKIDIGICWSASVTGESYEGKVFDLKYFEPLINHPKINLYSLQVGNENEQIKKYNGKIIDLTSKLTDFSKTASLVKQLDLVISSDTSVAHLCGAINAPVWIPLQKYPDWRWTNKGEDTKWYPSAKLFRQKTARVWDSVFQSLYAKLSKQFKIKIK
ncbi:hypothetical protein CRU99_05865 [Malaciobacter mytili]|uniref:beta-lactamase n=1 Tax=Malaciobacter mytili LMG 24559 TaxID=1032238 RepID=A0AAX2AJD2_9BACT|nr:tetratricopeptide repeat protein [Malaciobacter mytili]AXH15252.1 tetratricopeptide repeat protein [Malaciobacter mytili LMG 24559]RXI44060.1 hypothetical protein CRU99_05865 [Malaciobacter mytili]RXK15556.1 hypothetical protein CP985_07845 [Malaciobacter mytili LMG 24559]